MLREKQSARKGYKKISLFSSNIGSEKVQNMLISDICDILHSYYLFVLILQVRGKSTATSTKSSISSPSSLPGEVQRLVQYIYAEATNALTSSVAAKITEKGIETPLGILSLEQVEKGEAVLRELNNLLKSSSIKDSELEDLSAQFYTLIPHNLGGRSREQIRKAIIKSLDMLREKQELVQLMKDMLKVRH